MKVAQVTAMKAPNAVTVRDIPAPQPGPGEVAIRIEAAGVNHLDLLVSSGRLAVDVPLPHTLGIEGAGPIFAVGSGVSEDRLGEMVTVYPYVGCGSCRFCYVGEDQCCPVGQVRCIGMTLPGVMGEVAIVPARNAVKLPTNMTARDAAALSMTGMTAHRLVVTRGGIRPGETVLVRAVASGVGSIVTQMAKAAGATVIGTAGSDEKLQRASLFGMDHGIDHSAGSIFPRVKELTDGRGADVVLDYVGSATWDDNVRSIARGGRLLICGAHTGTKVNLDLWHLFAKEHQLVGSYGGTRHDLRAALDLAANGVISPVIHAVVPLERVGDALAVMEARTNFGKLVVSTGADRLEEAPERSGAAIG
jgi:NADPH:quinone reductase-like Zn-dependent oxidoreductase